MIIEGFELPSDTLSKDEILGTVVFYWLVPTDEELADSLQQHDPSLDDRDDWDDAGEPKHLWPVWRRKVSRALAGAVNAGTLAPSREDPRCYRIDALWRWTMGLDWVRLKGGLAALCEGLVAGEDSPPPGSTNDPWLALVREFFQEFPPAASSPGKPQATHWLERKILELGLVPSELPPRRNKQQDAAKRAEAVWELWAPPAWKRGASRS